MSAIEHTAAQATAASSATAAILTSMQEWALGLFGVPLPVVFGALAGAAYGVTFNKVASWWRLILSTVLTTALAAATAPFTVGFFTDSPPMPALAGAAAIVGFLLQFGTPWLRENRQSILDGLRHRWLGGPK